jgi:beta-N-acetylhexosaminidase
MRYAVIIIGVCLILIASFISVQFLIASKSQTGLKETLAQRPTTTPTTTPTELPLPIGRHFIIGHWANTSVASTTALIKKHNLGGVIIMSAPDTIDDITTWTAEWQRAVDYPLIIAIDQEGGEVSRLRGTEYDLTSQRDITTTETAHIVGSNRGRELAKLGITMNMAPVVDYSEKADSFLFRRSFPNIEQVPEFATAMMAGMNEHHVIAVPKHFPGHPDDQTDSHHSLPRIAMDKTALLASLTPWQQIIEKAAPAAIMTAHVQFPAIDRNYPATLSSYFLREVLRDYLGFAGLIITDDMSMDAIDNEWPAEVASRLALEAGADIILYAALPYDIEKAITYLTEYPLSTSTKDASDARLRNFSLTQ